jgi:hypothetical protein
MSKKEKKREAQIFIDANVDPKAKFGNPGLDSALQRQANANALHDILSQTKSIYTDATGKPAGGKRRKTRKGSEKSKKRKSKRRAK